LALSLQIYCTKSLLKNIAFPKIPLPE